MAVTVNCNVLTVEVDNYKVGILYYNLIYSNWIAATEENKNERIQYFNPHFLGTQIEQKWKENTKINKYNYIVFYLRVKLHAIEYSFFFLHFILFAFSHDFANNFSLTLHLLLSANTVLFQYFLWVFCVAYLLLNGHEWTPIPLFFFFC